MKGFTYAEGMRRMSWPDFASFRPPGKGAPPQTSIATGQGGNLAKNSNA